MIQKLKIQPRTRLKVDRCLDKHTIRHFTDKHISNKWRDLKPTIENKCVALQGKRFIKYGCCKVKSKKRGDSPGGGSAPDISARGRASSAAST